MADGGLTAQGTERKQQLVECAAELFSTKGYAETRVKDIVDAAGVAKGLFYWYFDNKDEVFAEVAADIRLRLRKAQAAVIEPDDPPIRQIHRATMASVRFMATHATFFTLLEVETDALPAEARRRGTAQHVDDVERLVRAGQADGSIVDEPADLLALGVVGAVGSFSHYHRTGRAATELDELCRFVADSVVRALAGTVEDRGHRNTT